MSATCRVCYRAGSRRGKEDIFPRGARAVGRTFCSFESLLVALAILAMPQPVAWGCTGLASVRTLDAGAVVRQEGRHSSPFQGNTRQSSTRQLGAAWAGHSRVATAAEGGVNLTGGGHRPGGSRLLPNLSATEALHWSGFFCDESFPASFLGRHEGDVAAPLLRGSVRRALPGSVLTTPPSITPHKSPVPPLAASASRHREFSLGRPQELTSLGRFANKGGRLKGVGSLGPKGSRAGGSGSQGPQSRKWPLGVPLGGQIKKRGTKRPYLLKPLGQLAKALTPQAGQTEVPGSDPFPAAPSPDRAAPAAAEAARSEAAASAGSAGLGTSAAAPPAPETAPKTVGEKGARKAAEEERREAGVEGEEVEEEREESPLAPVLREEQQLVSSWQAMLPDATPAARHSYYPRGFEDMDKGERLLTWRTGLILATGASLVSGPMKVASGPLLESCSGWPQVDEAHLMRPFRRSHSRRRRRLVSEAAQ